MKILRYIVLVSLLLVLLIWVSGYGYLFKGLRATYLNGTKTASIGDARFFDTRAIPATNPQPWPEAWSRDTSLSPRLQKVLRETRSIAYLVVQRDSLRLEKYWEGYSDSSQTNSFSMAKSITTLLAQRAIQDEYLPDWEARVIDYLPELRGPYRENLRLKHLSEMTAGLDWNEDYTHPFDITARAYYGSDIEKTMFKHVPVVREPGTHFEYQSGCTQLLAMVIMRATGKSLSDYASQSLWQDLGARHEARWHLDDKEGTELAYCCFNSNARDFARFGQMLLRHGRWQGKPVIDSSFVHRATRPAEAPWYGWSFWVLQDTSQLVYYMRGHHGQYVIVIPEAELVIVRLGHTALPDDRHHYGDLWVIVEETLRRWSR